jgi:Zn finger protein HypA/HybF involved in hydrogenase expression
MLCENCNNAHDGSYASGRFCCKKCSRAFSTRDKREIINAKVSLKLTGRPSNHIGYKQTPEAISKRLAGFTPEKRKAAAEKSSNTYLNKYKNTAFEDLSIGQKKKRIKEEQNFTCNRCGLSEWLGIQIKLEVEHKDGNTSNNIRSNLVALCPNCHSLTPTWRKSKGAKKRVCESLKQ